MAGDIKTIGDYDEITDFDLEDSLLVWVDNTGVTRRVKRKNLFNNADGVGIGTNAPTNALHVYRAVPSTGILVESDVGSAHLILDAAADVDPYIRFVQAGTPCAVIGVDASDSDKLKFSTGTQQVPGQSTVALIIDTNNDVTVVSDLNVGGTLTANDNVTLATGKKITLAGTADIYTAQGTWTPAITASSSNPTVSYGLREGYYKRVGNIVHFTFYMAINSRSGGAGTIRVTLPVGTATQYGTVAFGGFLSGVISSGDGTHYSWFVASDANYITLVSVGNSGNGVDIAGVEANSKLYGSGFYFV